VILLLLIYKCRIYLRKQFHTDHQFVQSSLIGKTDQAPHFRIKEGGQCAEFFSQTLYSYRRISKAVLIIFR